MGRILAGITLGVVLMILSEGTLHAANCEFRLGFKTIRDLIGHDIVGECLENEHYNEIGDSNQQTTGGLMAWRKADNWTAFTDGYRTWINGPNGLVMRLNTERFDWEADVRPETTPAPTVALTECPSENDVDNAYYIYVAKLSENGVRGYWRDVTMQHVIPRLNTARWACLVLRDFGWELSADFLDKYLERDYFYKTLCYLWQLADHPTQLQIQDQFNDFTFRQFSGWCGAQVSQATARPAPTPIPTQPPRPRPTPVPQPTATPAPQRYVDPGLTGALQVVRTTEWGELMYQAAYLNTDVTEIRFVRLADYGWDSFAALLDPIVKDDGISFRILFDESQRSKSNDVLAALLVHELWHAFAQSEGIVKFTLEGCLQDEINAYNAQARWWYERFGESGKNNPTPDEAGFNSLMQLWMNSTVESRVRELYREKCVA